jgi:hypothetical protein
MEFTFSEGTLRLNDEQARIVKQPPHQNLRILASAGSGKTTTLTGRIAWLLEHAKASPSEIILLTFTHNAAVEMQTRLEALVGNQRILCGTFHALSQQILNKSNPSALNDLYHVDELPLKALDFFDTANGKTFCKQIRWIFIDEYQDINEVQDRFIKALTNDNQTITIVGDDAQNIYSWRGSNIDYIMNFHERFPNVRDFQLSMNYRSSPAIVAVANSVMRYIPTLEHKELMIAATSHGPGSSRPEVRFFARTTEERDWVVEQAIKAKGTTVILSKYNSVLYAYEAAFLKLGVKIRFLNPDEKSHISLSTFHSAKGLEWDNVFISRMNDEVFPQQKDEDGVMQERRLFYVAVTRAKSTLTFTYSRNERSLSRFVREIHRPLLIFRNLPRYDLSTLTTTHESAVEDWVRSLTGEDFRTIKQLSLLPFDATEPVEKSKDTYVIPYWWMERGMAQEFFDFCRAYWHYEMACLRPDSGGQWAGHSTIWTIKIAAEDAALFEDERPLFEYLATTLFGTTEPGEPPPQIHYVEIAALIAARKHFDQKTLIRIIQIIHKMRTTLYNLRFAKVSLSDFQFAAIRHAPPQESRCQLIEAWRSYTSGKGQGQTSLQDIYLIGLCRAISEGRSGVLAELPGAKEWAKCRDFLAALKKEVVAVHKGTPIRKLICRLKDSVDMLVDTTVWIFVAGDQSTELKRLDRLITSLLLVHQLREAGHCIHRVCLYQMITGCKFEFDIKEWTSTMLYSYVKSLAKA